MRRITLLTVVLAAVFTVPWSDYSRTCLQDNRCFASRVASAQVATVFDVPSTEIAPWRLTDDFGDAAAVAAAEAAAAGIVASAGSITATDQDRRLGHDSSSNNSSSRSRDSRSRGRPSSQGHSSSSSSSSSSIGRRPDAADILRFWNSKEEEPQQASIQNSSPTSNTAAEPISNQRGTVHAVSDSSSRSSSSNSRRQRGRAVPGKAAPTRANRPLTTSRSEATSPSRPGPKIQPKAQRVVFAGVLGAEPAREVPETGRIASGQGDGKVVSIKAVNGEYDPNDTGSSGNPVLRPPGFYTDRKGVIDPDRGSSSSSSGGGSNGSGSNGSNSSGGSSNSSGGSSSSSSSSSGSSGSSSGSSGSSSSGGGSSNRSNTADSLNEPRPARDGPARGKNSHNNSTNNRDTAQAPDGQGPRKENQQQNFDAGNRDTRQADGQQQQRRRRRGQQQRQRDLDQGTPAPGHRDSNSENSTETRPAREENRDGSGAGDRNTTVPARNQQGDDGQNSTGPARNQQGNDTQNSTGPARNQRADDDQNSAGPARNQQGNNDQNSAGPTQIPPGQNTPNRDTSKGDGMAQERPRGSNGDNNRMNDKGPSGNQPDRGSSPRAPAANRGGSSSGSSNSRRNRRPVSGTVPPESSGAGSTVSVPPPLANPGSSSGGGGSGSSSSGDVEQQQLLALRQLLPKLLVVGTQTWPLVDGLFKDAPTNLSGWLAPQLDTGVRDFTEFIDTRGYGFLSVTMIRDAGKVYVTELYAYDAGMDLSVLPQLVSQLPRLQSFTCSNCMRNERGPDSAMQLPQALGDAAPASLAMLSLGGGKIRGSLPEAWSRWNTLEQLWVWDNALTGTIPASWKSMNKLRVFYAEQNQFTGELPASWGTGALPANLSVYLHKNLKLSGGIPDSWSRFSGVIDVSATNITGCVPDLLVDNVITDGTPEPCSPNNPNSELTALLGIRNGIKTMMGQKALASWTDTRVAGKAAATGGALTLDHCRWQGIACNSDGRVTTLDLSFLKPDPEEYETPLPKLMQYVKRLKHLQVLNLANMALVGALQEDKPLSDDMGALAADLTQLRVLNISSNPGVTGSFPRLWAGLTSLQALDVSNTGVISKLPDVWGSLQQLQVFRAASTQIYGNLPGAWGMMKSITEIDLTGCNITGPLPAQWADAAAMQAVAAAAVQSAQQIAIAAHQDAQQAKTLLMETKDQLEQQPAMTARDPTASAQISSASVTDAAPAPIIAAAQDSIAVAMDQYRQVQLQATQSQMIADTMQYALSRAAQDMQLNAYGLGMMNLQVLKLSNNIITGGLPVSYASFWKMRVLNLSGNDLSGPLPMEWAAMDSLQELSLANNPRLSGVLPDYWARLTNLIRLDLSNCGLSGKLPATWVSLQNVVSLNLSNNLFSGDVPDAWSFMTASKYKLRCLNLSGNSGLTNVAKVQEAWQENSATKVVIKAGGTC